MGCWGRRKVTQDEADRRVAAEVVDVPFPREGTWAAAVGCQGKDGIAQTGQRDASWHGTQLSNL